MLEKLNKLILGRSEVMNGFFFLFGPVDTDMAQTVVEWIIEENFDCTEGKSQILNLLINSPGGNLSDAFAIIDTMNSSKIPIRTVGLGEIASAGLMIFMNGSERVLTPNTSIMSHQFSAGALGKDHELFAVAKEFTYTRDRMMNHYMKCTKLKRKKIEEILLPNSDVYLSAEEALKYNICDKVANL